jgi:cell fate regulator YaaT (PSP1 superfamily)
MELVDIRLVRSGDIYRCNTKGAVTNIGDACIVEVDNAKDFAVVVSETVIKDKKDLKGKPLNLVRMATKADEHRFYNNEKLAEEAFATCQEKIKHHKLKMKLVTVKYYFDQSKIMFYFTADNRVDFRALVKDLANTFHTRIELRQIGVRKEAKMIGGYGVCGIELCCKRNVCKLGQKGNKEIVSIKMAKEQDLSLNSSKVTGVCGRLMCCISYEYDFYRKEKKKYPRVSSKLTHQNENYTVMSVNIISRQVLLRTEEASYRLVNIDDLRQENNAPAVSK